MARAVLISRLNFMMSYFLVVIYSQVSGVSDIITNNNIALWKLSAPVSLDTYTRICLPAQVSGVDTIRESDQC